MGNTCRKVNTRIAPDDQPHTRSRRWRLKQALGLGKYCATVDVQRKTAVSPSNSTVVIVSSESTILNGPTSDSLFLVSSSSQARIQDNEACGSESGSNTVENSNHGQAIDTQPEEISSEETVSADSTTVENSQQTADTDADEHGASQDTSPSILRTTTYLDYNGNIVTLTHNDLADDGDSTADNNCTSQGHITGSKSDRAAVSNVEIIPSRVLSPAIFSASAPKPYDEFPGEVDIEIEEDIQADLEDPRIMDDTINDCTLYATNGESCNTFGQGVVVLVEADIKAAMSRLASLREGIDPEIDNTHMFKCSTTDNDNEGHENIGRNGQATKSEGQNSKNETSEDKIKDKNRFEAAIVDEHNLQDKDAVPVTDGEPKIEYDNGKENAINVTATTNNTVQNGRDNSLPKPDTLKTSRDDNYKFEKKVDTADVGNTGASQSGDTMGLCEKKISEESIKSSISSAAALSLDAIKSHNTRSDCLLSLCVRPPQSGLEPRKTEVRASAKQIKDGTAEKHLKLLKNIHNLPKVADPTSVTPKRTKKHLYTSPALAKRDGTSAVHCVQKQGNPGLPVLHSLPTSYEPTAKGPNAREKLGLEQLKKFKIGIQCKPIERIKIDAEEFPGILPPKIRTKWRQKMDEKKHIN